MSHQIGSKLYVLDRIIQDYIDDDLDCKDLQNLRATLHDEKDIAPAIAEFLKSEAGCAWEEWEEIIDFALKLNSNAIPFKELCIYYIHNEEYESAVLSFHKSRLDLKDFLKETNFWSEYEESKFFDFLQELSSAYVTGSYYDISKDPIKGFELLYNFIEEYNSCLPEHVSDELLDTLYGFCNNNECLKPRISDLKTYKDFDDDFDEEDGGELHTLKDYISKDKLTIAEQEELVEKLWECSSDESSEAFFDCFLEDVPQNVQKLIKEQGLEDSDIALAISDNYREYGSFDSDYIGELAFTEKTIHTIEQENIWFIKALELYDGDCFLDTIDCDKIEEFVLTHYTNTLLEKNAFADLYNSWACKYALDMVELDSEEDDANIEYARQLFEKSKKDEAKISLYHIYANGLGVKKNLKKAKSYLKNIPADTELYAFKSNVSDGIRIERLEYQEAPPSQPGKPKGKTSRKPRKKNKLKSILKKILKVIK